MDFWTVVGCLAVLALATQSWFWLLALYVGGIASLFAMVASVIQFQILAAVAFFFLMIACWGLASFVASYRLDGTRSSNLSTAFNDIDR